MQPAVYGNRTKNNAIFMILLMVATPALTLQTGLLEKDLAPEELENSIRSTSGTTPLPDCSLTDVSVTEVYHDSSSDWIEIYNSGSSDCDLGGWHIRDDDTSSGMVLSNGTNITSGGFMLFERGNGDFSFDISYSDSLLISTRNVSTTNAAVVTTLDYYGRDNEGYSTSRDGSWELCDGVWDYNEPDEMTPNATNLCAGEPFMLYVLESDGSWTEDPDTVSSGTSTLAWDTSNLDDGQSYYISYSWYTDFRSHGESLTFTADGSYIEFDLNSDPDWTCDVRVDAYIQNSTSGVTIEYYDETIDVDCGEEITDLRVNSPWPLSDGHDLSSGSFGGTAGFQGGNDDRTYRTVYTVEFDGDYVAFKDLECPAGDDECWADFAVIVPGHVCEVEFAVYAYVLTPHKWIEVGYDQKDFDGPCDGSTGEDTSVLSLYAIMDDANGGQGWYEVSDENDELNFTYLDGTSTNRLQHFYWDIDESANGTGVRLYWYFENDNVMDDYFVYDGQPIYWNASVHVTDCHPTVYAYLYLELPDGVSKHIDYWHESFETDCEDWGDVDLHLHNMTYTGSSTNNGSNDLIWNLSNLEVGENYVFEWFTDRSSSYTADGESSLYGDYHNKTVFTATSNYTHLNWTLETPGEWCDVDVNAYLYADFDETQEWWDEDDANNNEWTSVSSHGFDLDPVCDGTEVVPYDPVSLWHLDQTNNWVEVNETTNLSVGTHQMMWEVSGTNAGQNLELNTNIEAYLNSSKLYSYYDGTWDFNVIWELPISDWSCHIDFEYDLYFRTHTGNQYRMDHENGDPVIDGPCNDAVDLTEDTVPEFSLSIVDTDGSLDDLDEVAELEEGDNTFRWGVEESLDGYEHSITMYLRYNGKIQEIRTENFFGDTTDVSGDWTVSIDEDACDIYLYSEMYVKDYNGWFRSGTLSEHFGYSGSSTNCDYEGSQITFSKLGSDGTWDNDPELLESGVNQLRFNIGSLSLTDNMTYYINTYVQGEGSNSESYSTYFNVGNPSNPSYSNYDAYQGGDIYLNYTVNDWTCTSQASAHIYYISLSGNWITYASMPTRYFQNTDCDPAGDISVSAILDGNWEEELELNNNGWDLPSGTTDLYWNMTGLNIGERYSIYFYAYVDNEYAYSHAGDTWYATSDKHSWHFDLDIEESSCDVWGYGTLRIWNDGSMRNLETVYFYADEPCIAPYDLIFEDASSSTGWTDSTTSTLPKGTVQMMFDLSGFGHGDYEVDYYWNGDHSGGHGWYYDNQFTVNETIDGYYWNMTLDDEDCEIYVNVRVYEVSNGQNDRIGGTYTIDLDGPCILPAVLEIDPEADGAYVSAGSELFSAGTNEMRWNLDNLEVGSDYRVDYYWRAPSTQGDVHFDHDFTHDGSHIDWQLNATIWDCEIYVRVYVYNDSAGGSQIQSWSSYFHPDDCVDGGRAVSQVNRSYGWTDSHSNSNVDNGSNEMRWRMHSLVENQTYQFEWLVYRNNDYASHHYFEFNSTSSEHTHEFTLDVEEEITCEIRLRFYLYVLTDEGTHIEVHSGSDYLNPNCNYEADFNQFPILVLDDNDTEDTSDDSWVVSDLIENGDHTFRIDLSGLDQDREYNSWGHISTNFDHESWNWGDFYPADRDDYVEVEMTVDEWVCQVETYLYVGIYLLDGDTTYIKSGSEYTDSPCVNTGDVELEIDSEDVGYSMGLENGSNDMSWNLTELVANTTYTFEWRVQYNNDYVSYVSQTWNTGTNTSAMFDWDLDVDTSTTCNVRVYYRTFVDITGSGYWAEMDNGNYYESFSCDQYVYPEDHYVNIEFDVNGTWVEGPETMPYGFDVVQLTFENMSDGANYLLYFSYSGTGFNSKSDHIYFTYDGEPMDIDMPIAPWACSISYNWYLQVYDFRYGTSSSTGHNSWWMGSDSGSLDGPCLTMSYDSSDSPYFNVTDGSGSEITTDYEFSETDNTLHLAAENLQSDFPYYMEARVYFNGYLNIFDQTTWFGNSTVGEALTVEFDVPGFVCEVDVRAYLYVRTPSGNTQLYYEDIQNADGPCDGSGSWEDARLSIPLYALINGTWVLVDDDTVIPPGQTDMYWDLSSLDTEEEVFFYQGGHSHWSGMVDGNDHPFEWTWTVSEFQCDLYIYSWLEFRAGSDWTGSHSTGSNYIYPETDCLDGGDITLDIQDDQGNWSSYEDGEGYDYHLNPGTTNMSWNLTGLLEGYEYEFYWYLSGNHCCEYTYEYFTADSAGIESFDFEITIDRYECNIYWYAYLRPMSEYSGSYHNTESFSFNPQEPCNPPFDLVTTDDEGDLTLNALESGFSLLPGDNHLFMDFGNMDNGTQYEVDYYFSDSDGGNGWYYDLIVDVDLSDDVPDGIHFNMTMDSFDCYAYLQVRVYNLSDGQRSNMFDRSINLDGPCQKPVSLLVNGTETGEMDSMDLSLGDNEMTWAFDYLEDGVDYYLQWYYSNDSSWNGWFYEYFTYNGSNDVDWNLHLGIFDCQAYAYAYLYYDGNGSSAGPSDSWHFNTPDCADVWIDIEDETGNYVDSDQIDDGTHNLSWVVYDLPEGYDYAFQWRVYENGDMQSYDYVLFTESGNISIDFEIEVEDDVCDLRLEGEIYYLVDESSNHWDQISSNSRSFSPECEGFQSLYPWTTLTDTDGDGNYSEVSDWDNVGGNQTIPFAIDVTDLAGSDIQFTIEYRWNTASDSGYFDRVDVTTEQSVFYFDVPVTQWDCDVNIYVDLRYEDFRGQDRHFISNYNNFETDCQNPGNVSLIMDGMGEVWDDWSNLNNGTNDMAWELEDLTIGGHYTLDWFVRLNNDYVLYEHQTWVATVVDHSIEWGFSIDNSTTCNLEVSYRLFVDTDDGDSTNWMNMADESFYWSPSCNEWVYPDDRYANFEFDVNGTWVEDPDDLPAGETAVQVTFENLTVGATYRMYMYYSSTGFPSQSEYYYFTYDGNLMELTIPIAPWACSMYFSWDMTLYDFRYPDSDYNSWYLGSEGFYIDGPCESLSYDSSDYPDFSVTDDSDTELDEDTQLSAGENTVTISVENLQDRFPYAAEIDVRYEGYLNFFESQMIIVDNFTSHDFHFTFEVPGFVCNVDIFAKLYVKTSTWSNTELNNSYLYNMEGPCDGTDGDAKLSTPLYAKIDGNWVIVDDDTLLAAGETEMYYDISWMGDTEYYFSFDAPGYGWGDWVSADDGPIEFSAMLSEFDCNPNFYSYMRQESDFSGWHYYDYTYLYPETDCIEEAGEIALDIQDAEGNWSSYQSYDSYDLLPGTTSMSWNLTGLLEGYEYEFYWYVNSEYYCQTRSHTTCAPDSDDQVYEYFTADSTTTTMSFDFSLTIDRFLCDMTFNAYLRPMSEHTGDYDEVASFYFSPEEPCYPPFNLFATDDEGNLTVDALDPAFSLEEGVNHLFFDFGHMDNGTEYRLEWYYDDSDGWYGWFYDDVVVDTSDNVTDGIHFNMSMDSFDCEAYFFARVYNRTDGQNTNMFDRTRYLQGPCLKPFALEVGGNTFGHDDGSNELEVGDNDLTWVFDNLETGVNYRYDWYWSTGSSSSSQNYYFTYNGSNDLDFVLSVGGWDCNPYTRGSLYYADNGSHIYGNEYFYFHVPDCYNVWMDLLDSSGDYPDSDDIGDGANDFSWAVYDLPEGFDYALEMRTYKNGYMHSYGYETFNDSGNMTFDLSVLVDTSEVCDLRLEASLYYLEDGSDNNWYHISGNSWYSYPDCDDYQSLYPWAVLADDDGDGNFLELNQYEDTLAGNTTIPMVLDFSELTDGDYRVEFQWSTQSDNVYFNWQEITPTNSQFEFDVPVSQWDCEIYVYVNIHYNSFRGYYNHMTSRGMYFQTDCTNPGSVSLEMDGMGEAWEDWSNLNNGTNNMSWELEDLVLGANYALDWYVRMNYDFVLYQHEIWEATDNSSLLSWSFDLDNSTTCNIEIYYRLWVDSSESTTPNWINMDSNSWMWYPDCEEWVYPDDHYVNFHALVNGSWVEEPDTLPAGDNEIEVHFENLTVGAEYRLYLYHSSTGFPSESNNLYFTYDGTPMELTLPVAPWACSMYFSWEITLYDFRYQDGDSYNSWWMGSDSFYVDGPCESLSYNYSSYPEFSLVDANGDEVDDETGFSAGDNTVTVSVDNLQDLFPYAAEVEVRYDGYLNFFESQMIIVDNFTSFDWDFTFDVPGFVCDVEINAKLFVKTDTYSNSELNSTYVYDADGPCDGTEGDAMLRTPLYAMIDGNWTLVDDDTLIPPGHTEMYWDISWMGDTEYYFTSNSPGWGWSDYVTGDDGPIEWTMHLDEFECDYSIYSYMRQNSQFSGWHYYDYTWIYPETDCLEDAGEIHLDIQGEDGSWTTYESHQYYELVPGTTELSWNLTGMLEGYEYEFYWYQGGSDYNSHYEYFTADSTGTASFDFDLTINVYECNVYFYAYLRPMSEYTGNYEQVASFSFHPDEPCKPPFDLMAQDDEGNFTVDALGFSGEDFSLGVGTTEMLFDFSGMDNGSSYYLEWYWSTDSSWNGWYYDQIDVNHSSDISGLLWNITMESMDCNAHIYVSLRNYTDGMNNHMGSFDLNIDGPCLLPIDLESDHDQEVYTGTNEMTWVLDNLDVGSNYSLQYYYSMTTGWYGWFYHDFTFNGTEYVDFSVNVTDWDCNVNVNADIYNVTDGNNDRVYGFYDNFHNPDCYEVWMEPTDDDGDYIAYDDIDSGVTELLWQIGFNGDTVPSGQEFELEWYYLFDWDWNNQVTSSFTWTHGDENTIEIPWNVTANDFQCNLYSNANLRVNSSDGWINVRSYGFNLHPPCEEMPGGWYELQIDDGGTWVDYDDGWNHEIGDAGVYDVRFNATMLEEGVTYSMSYSAYVYGHELDSQTVSWNATEENATVDLILAIPHWYCGMELYSSLSFDHEGTLFELVQREYYEEGPCQTGLEEDFSDSFEVQFNLELIDEGDYQLTTHFGWGIGGDVMLWMDAVWGNMDGVLNTSEAAGAFSEINGDGYDGSPDEAPPFQLNGDAPSAWSYSDPTLDEAWLGDSSLPMTFSGVWVVDFHDIFGVDLEMTLPIFRDEADLGWLITFLGNDDLPLASGYLLYENGTSYADLETAPGEYGVQTYLTEGGNFTIGAEWVLADIPNPSITFEQYDNSTGTYGEFTGLVEGWNQLQLLLGNLSEQEYTVHHSVIFDGIPVQNGSTTIPADVSEFSYVAAGHLDIFTCVVEIIYSVQDRNGVEINNTALLLDGICAQTEFNLIQHFPAQESPEYVCHEIAGDPSSPVQYINFSLVNDGVEDCGDGADEPFDMDLDTDSDGDGNSTNDPDSWYDCYDGTTISMALVNDGNSDCFMGEDEYFYEGSSFGPPTTAMGLSDGMYDYSIMFEAVAHNLSSTSNWSITFDVVIDGEIHNSSGSLQIPEGSVHHMEMIELSTNIEACFIDIIVTLVETPITGENASTFASAVHGLSGECVEDSDLDGYLDWFDRFPMDPNEWEDSDSDGWGDNADVFPNDPNEHTDSDMDGVGDNSDAFPWDPTEYIDTDGDGWGDGADEFPNDESEWQDTDGDGIGDNADTDSDGDGVNDDLDDSDGDGVNDDQDDFPFDANETTDSDGDGVGDNSDAFPNNATEWSDTDGDGIGDNSDGDVDGDGVDNEFDTFPLNPAENSDSDGDGVGDAQDAFPNDPSETADTDGDGVGNNADTDDDNDGTLDNSDAFPLDPSEDTDSDRDGFGDNVDAFANDPGEWVDTDGDGVGDNSDRFPADPSEQFDSDLDGVGDSNDAFPDDPTEYLDSDQDGVGDFGDAFPFNADEQKDTDGDGVGDNADTDADGDGVPDDTSDVPDADDDDGGILPGFSAVAGLASMLGAAVLIAGRRKD